jgi:hypothetical protein
MKVQRALPTEISGFAAATLRRNISTFRNYQILFSINVKLTCMCYPFRQGTLGTGRVVKLMDLGPNL